MYCQPSVSQGRWHTVDFEKERRDQEEAVERARLRAEAEAEAARMEEAEKARLADDAKLAALVTILDAHREAEEEKRVASVEQEHREQLRQQHVTEVDPVASVVDGTSCALMECPGSEDLTAGDDDTGNLLYVAIARVHGSWDTGQLGVQPSDYVRVMNITDDNSAVAYVLRRNGNAEFPDLAAADVLARSLKIYGRVPMSALMAMRPITEAATTVGDGQSSAVVLPASVPMSRNPVYDEIINALTCTPELIPEGGWHHYLENSGILFKHDGGDRWQFYAYFWGDNASMAGKTCGVCMSPYSEKKCLTHEYLRGARHAQLSIERDSLGQSMMRGDLRGMKQGILMYLPAVTVSSVSRQLGVAVPEKETSVRLSLTGLLITYAEVVSIVRKAIFANLNHPCGGRPYPAQTWDETHTPYCTRFPGATRDEKPVATQDLSQEIAPKVAKKWLSYEKLQYPQYWPDEDYDALKAAFKKPAVRPRSSTGRRPREGKAGTKSNKRQRSDAALPASVASSPALIEETQVLVKPGTSVAIFISWAGVTGWCKTRVKECPALESAVGMTFEVDDEVFTEEMQQTLTRDVPFSVLDEKDEPVVTAPLYQFL